MRLISTTLLLTSVFLAAAVYSDNAAAQVNLRCDNGASAPVPTNGFIINNLGEVVFSEESIACNVQQNPGLPDALNLAITSPAIGAEINVAAVAQNVLFSAQITNYTVGVDVCRVQVKPPSAAAWPAVVLQPNGTGLASTNLLFGMGIAAGNYTLELSCTRTSNGQQVIVPVVTRILKVLSIAEPSECDSRPIPNIFSPVTQRDFTSPYLPNPEESTWPGSGGYGAQPTQATNWRYWGLDNSFAAGVLTNIELRTWKFRPTANSIMAINKGSMGSSQIAISISECPGQFTDLPDKCQRNTGSVQWSTRALPDTAYCKLDPSKDYYISVAQFDRAYLQTNGVYRSAVQCVGTTCTTENVLQSQNKTP